MEKKIVPNPLSIPDKQEHRKRRKIKRKKALHKQKWNENNVHARSRINQPTNRAIKMLSHLPNQLIKHSESRPTGGAWWFLLAPPNIQVRNSGWLLDLSYHSVHLGMGDTSRLQKMFEKWNASKTKLSERVRSLNFYTTVYIPSLASPLDNRVALHCIALPPWGSEESRPIKCRNGKDRVMIWMAPEPERKAY